jgi:YHS domain-containing protein
VKTAILSFASFALSLSLFPGQNSQAQSGTRQPAAARSSRSAKSAPVALQGYCPVCATNMRKWVAGSPRYSVVYDGHTYLFPGEEQKLMFEADPARYTPALHGDCVVCAVEMKKRVPGSVRTSQLYDGRLFLFPGEKQRKMFTADPTKYANADLALGGKCAVCRVEMNQNVPGKPQYTVHYQGLRYLFPGPEQKKMFLANPGKYAVRAEEGSGTRKDSQSSNSSMSKVRVVTIQGKTGCAGCDHGIKLLGKPEELALSVTTPERIYVVEDAKTLYPAIYESRFEGHQVELAGTVLKEQGKFVWVRPDRLTLVQKSSLN